MKGILLFFILTIIYVGGSIFCRKKETPTVWNSLAFLGITMLLSLLFRHNYILRLPQPEDNNYLMCLIYSGVICILCGVYGKYMKGDKTYQCNALFLRSLILDIGFAGLVLPYLHEISIMTYLIDVGFVMLSIGMICTVAAEVTLNLIGGEYHMSVPRQIAFDLVITILNTLLIYMTTSVWLALIPRGIYALCRVWKNRRLKGGE